DYEQRTERLDRAEREVAKDRARLEREMALFQAHIEETEGDVAERKKKAEDAEKALRDRQAAKRQREQTAGDMAQRKARLEQAEHDYHFRAAMLAQAELDLAKDRMTVEREWAGLQVRVKQTEEEIARRVAEAEAALAAQRQELAQQTQPAAQTEEVL